MLKRIVLGSAVLLIVPAPVLAQEPVQTGSATDALLLPAVLVMLLPLGLLLLISSAMPPEKAPAAAIKLLMVWAVAVLAYFGVGFAFNFGGVAQVTPRPDLAGLYWEWYPFDPSVDVDVVRLWGLVALRGWALLGEAATSGAILLFVTHASLVGAAAMIPAGVLLARQRSAAALFGALLMGALVYPVAGNWVWGGGWLSNLGASLGLGHGFVDFGGAGVLFLTAAGVSLAALTIFKPASPDDVSETMPLNDIASPEVEDEPSLEIIPMPSAHLPILSMLGGGLVLMGWFGVANGIHNPTTVNVSAIHAAAGGMLAALAGALAAAGYSWFTTRQFDPLMTSRGLVAGLVVAVAGAPFIPLWMLLLTGMIMGFLLPVLIYFFERRGWLVDTLGALSTYGIGALVGLLLVGFVADGSAGQGWNRIGPLEYLGIPAQGVSGALVDTGYVADWPGQIQAQLLGIGGVLLWSLLMGAVLFQVYLVATNAWHRTGVEAPDDELELPVPDAEITAIEIEEGELPAEESSSGLLRRLNKT